MSKVDNRTTGNKLLDSLKVETEVIGFSQSQLTLYIAQAEELVKKLAYDLDRYKGGYHVLMEHFDSIPDDEKQDVDSKLMKLDL
jgi:hypothetical protein|tara:strand:- start:1375 stop:1626 length:252 start_codon:yes stop_codon:yes gene_type:complete